MPPEMPTKVEAVRVKTLHKVQEDPDESSESKFDSAHENVHESALVQFSHLHDVL